MTWSSWHAAALGIFLQMALQENLRNSRPYS